MAAVGAEENDHRLPEPVFLPAHCSGGSLCRLECWVSNLATAFPVFLRHRVELFNRAGPSLKRRPIIAGVRHLSAFLKSHGNRCRLEFLGGALVRHRVDQLAFP